MHTSTTNIVPGFPGGTAPFGTSVHGFDQDIWLAQAHVKMGSKGPALTLIIAFDGDTWAVLAHALIEGQPGLNDAARVFANACVAASVPHGANVQVIADRRFGSGELIAHLARASTVEPVAVADLWVDRMDLFDVAREMARKTKAFVRWLHGNGGGPIAVEEVRMAVEHIVYWYHRSPAAGGESPMDRCERLQRPVVQVH